MPLIQLELTEEQDKKIELCKIKHNLNTKAEALAYIVDQADIEVRAGKKIPKPTAKQS